MTWMSRTSYCAEPRLTTVMLLIRKKSPSKCGLVCVQRRTRTYQICRLVPDGGRFSYPENDGIRQISNFALFALHHRDPQRLDQNSCHTERHNLIQRKCRRHCPDTPSRLGQTPVSFSSPLCPCSLRHGSIELEIWALRSPLNLSSPSSKTGPSMDLMIP